MANLTVRDSTGTTKELKATGSGTTVDPIVPEQRLCETGLVRQSFFQRIDLIGDGTGSTNQAVDGSVTPQVFKYAPAANKIARVLSVTLSVMDTGVIDPVNWGNSVVLANGFDMNAKLNTVTTSIMGFPIKTTADFVGVASSTDHLSFSSGDEILVMRFDFTKSGQPIRLDGSVSDEFQVVINDDLTAINSQYMLIEGYYE